MGSILNPYVQFDGDAREAMEFYHSVLGGDLKVMTFADSGMPGPGSDKVMHARLTSEAGYTIMASDMPPGTEYRPGQNVSISISGDEADRLRGYWEALGEGATVTVPLEKQMWGDEFGALVDRFGVNWMVDIVGDSSQ